jgi:methylated-DNA-[protein]-cysteine S-methyltransferase
MTDLTSLLRPEPPAAAVTRVQDAVRRAADPAGLVDIAYRTVDTPVGPLLLAATEQGVLRVAYAREGHDAVLDGLAASVSPRILRAPGRLDAVARQLEEYFAAGRQRFDLQLDLRLARGFRRDVLLRLPAIGYGRVASYGTVAAGLGNPGAVRAVGTACARNPLPLLLPCHRVVRRDGRPGDYVGGPEVKRALLRLEGAPVG